MKTTIWTLIVLALVATAFYAGLSVGEQMASDDLDRKDRLLAECTEISKARGRERDTYQRELTDSIVMLRKLDGVYFAFDKHADSIVACLEENGSRMEGDSLLGLCKKINAIRKFTGEQRKRVHWDLEDPEPDLQPMSEEEFEQFQKMVRDQMQSKATVSP